MSLAITAQGHKLATGRAPHSPRHAVSCLCNIWGGSQGRWPWSPERVLLLLPAPSPTHVTGRLCPVSPRRRSRRLLLQWRLQGGQPQGLQHRRHRGQVPAAHGRLRDRYRVHCGSGAHQPGPQRHGACASASDPMQWPPCPHTRERPHSAGRGPHSFTRLFPPCFALSYIHSLRF